MEPRKNRHRRPPQELSERTQALVRWCHHRTRMKLIRPSCNIIQCTFCTRAKSYTGVFEWATPPDPGAPYVLDLTAPSNAMVLQLNSWTNFQLLTQCSSFMLPLPPPPCCSCPLAQSKVRWTHRSAPSPRHTPSLTSAQGIGPAGN